MKADFPYFNRTFGLTREWTDVRHGRTEARTAGTYRGKERSAPNTLEDDGRGHEHEHKGGAHRFGQSYNRTRDGDIHTVRFSSGSGARRRRAYVA